MGRRKPWRNSWVGRVLLREAGEEVGNGKVIHGNGRQESSNGNGVGGASVADPSADASGDAGSIRNKLGRYQIDNPGGPGNPFGRHVVQSQDPVERVLG